MLINNNKINIDIINNDNIKKFSKYQSSKSTKKFKILTKSMLFFTVFVVIVHCFLSPLFGVVHILISISVTVLNLYFTLYL